MIQHILPSCNKPVGSVTSRQAKHIDIIPDTEYNPPAAVLPFRFWLHRRLTPKPFWLLFAAERLLPPVFVTTRHGLFVQWEDMQYWRKALFKTRKR